MAPEFTVKLSSKDKVVFHKIKVDSEIIDKQIEDFAKRYGQMKAADVAEKDDMVFGEFVQKEGDITAKSTVSIPLIDDAKIQKKFIGLKAGDKWCLCAARWQEAFNANCAPKVVLSATNQACLTVIKLEDLNACSIPE